LPRTARACSGGYTYHVLNRGNARSTVFHKAEDYGAFTEMMAEASVRVPMRILAYSLMPNHFHLAVWPSGDNDLSRWTHWLMTTHVRRYLRHYRSSGHVCQGRCKAFPVQEDEHLLTVLRHVERNPLRAGLIERPEAWTCSSVRWLSALDRSPVRLEPGTEPRGKLWIEGVNAASAGVELEAVRESIRRDRPFGSPAWTVERARDLGLEYSLRPRGRPKTGEPSAGDGTTKILQTAERYRNVPLFSF
jgi:putative transposase